MPGEQASVLVNRVAVALEKIAEALRDAQAAQERQVAALEALVRGAAEAPAASSSPQGGEDDAAFGPGMDDPDVRAIVEQLAREEG